MALKLKNIFFILFLISLLVLLLGSSCTTYASSFSVNTVVSAVQHLKDNGYLNNFNTTTGLNDNTFKNTINSNSFTGYAIYKLKDSVTNVDNKIRICFYWGTSGNSNSSGSSLAFKENGQLYNTNLLNNVQMTTDNIELAYSSLYTINNLSLTKGQIYDINAPTFTFTPEYISQTTGNPVLNLNKFNYNSPRINLGIIEDLDYYAIEVRFKDENGLIIGSDLELTNQNNYSNLEWENNALYRYGQQLYANTIYLKYEKTYNLNFKVYSDRNNYDEFDFYYIFYPPNAIIENGVVISAGSGDYDNQDLSLAIQQNINNLIGSINDDSQIEGILNTEFTSNSGDIEVYAEKFGFTALDNPFTTFLLHILEETFDALTDPNNTTLSADYKTLHFELNSDDFTTPDSPTKDFIRNLLIFLYLYGNYRFFNHLLVLIQTAKIDKAIATLGTDEFYDSDIM